MRYSKIQPTLFCAATIAAGLTLNAHAQNLNGTVNNTFYGAPLAVQTVNTGFGNAPGGTDSTVGSELDAAYGKISGGNLYLFLAGNFENNGNHLNVFIDGGAVGETTLSTSGGTMAAMNGSTFASGFQATFAYDMNDYSGTLYSEQYNLVGGSQVSGGYVGALGNSGTGIYAGSDGGGLSLYLNNTHASTMGAAGSALSGATSGANTTTGLEMVIPLSLIGYTGGSIEVAADINGGGDTYLSNQLLPGLSVGSGNLGNGGVLVSAPFFVVTVPEPSTLALAGLSGAAMLFGFRRRK